MITWQHYTSHLNAQFYICTLFCYIIENTSNWKFYFTSWLHEATRFLIYRYLKVSKQVHWTWASVYWRLHLFASHSVLLKLPTVKIINPVINDSHFMHICVCVCDQYVHLSFVSVSAGCARPYVISIIVKPILVYTCCSIYMHIQIYMATFLLLLLCIKVETDRIYRYIKMRHASHYAVEFLY